MLVELTQLQALERFTFDEDRLSVPSQGPLPRRLASIGPSRQTRLADQYKRADSEIATLLGFTAYDGDHHICEDQKATGTEFRRL